MTENTTWKNCILFYVWKNRKFNFKKAIHIFQIMQSKINLEYDSTKKEK